MYCDLSLKLSEFPKIWAAAYKTWLKIVQAASFFIKQTLEEQKLQKIKNILSVGRIYWKKEWPENCQSHFIEVRES